MTRQQSGGDHGRMPRRPIDDEKQPTGARALAGIGIRELAAVADIAPRIRHRFAPGGVLPISERAAMAVCIRIMAAPATAASKSWRKGGSFGAVVRWTVPRRRRSPDTVR